MIHPFRYSRAADEADATRRLSEPGAAPVGGGTDLLPAMRERLVQPETVVDLTRVPGAAAVTWMADGGLRIGGAVRLAQLARDPRVRERFTALAEACESVGTPALRTMGTIAGNLCQRPRCWYLRSGVSCYKSGGEGCPAASGENQYHAILGGGPCYIVHPSDVAVALVALEAVVEIRGSGGSAPSRESADASRHSERNASGAHAESRDRDRPDRAAAGADGGVVRQIPVAELYVLPAERLDGETALQPGEWVSAVEIPAGSAGGVQRYEKVMQRAGWDFALVSLASVRRVDGGVRLVLGGVAPKPWRVSESVEEDVAVGGLSEDDIGTLAERALYDARPLAKNGYKVELAAAVLRRGIIGLNQTV